MLMRSAALVVAFLSPGLAVGAEDAGNGKNPQAVQEVLSGKRTEANASWWGFDEDDATEALQAAIHSGAKQVVVPNMKKDWIVRPIQLAGDQELVLEDGVCITAKRGEYRGGGDSVLTATNLDNLTIRGAGATVRMHKEDYIVGLVLKDLGWHRWFDQYVKAEWRMALSIRGCNNVNVFALTLRDSGGDGIYVDGTGERPCSTNVHFKDIVCDNNYRQGLSVISVDGLLVENSVFKNTWGTPPSSGVDIEPDAARQKVKGVVFRNCRFEDNYGDGIEVFLAHLSSASDDVSILFDHCRVTSKRGSGIRVAKIFDDGPNGLVEFRNCAVEHTEAYGIAVHSKAADRARVRFVGCSLRDVARDRNYQGPWAPIWLRPSEPERIGRHGGIDFIDCLVEDNRQRPALVVFAGEKPSRLSDVRGSIRVSSPLGTEVNLGERDASVTLELKKALPPRP